MQGIADLVNPDDVQIISFHPGSVRTEAVMKSKWANAPIAWNTGKWMDSESSDSKRLFYFIFIF